LDLKKELEYPCFCEYGILNQPFQDKLIFKGLKEEPLNESENMLSDLMIKMIVEAELTEKYRNGNRISGKFDIECILDEWEELLKKI